MVSSEKLRSPPSWPVSQRSSSDSVLSSKMLCAFAPGEFEVLPFISIITCALLIFGAKCNRKTARRAAVPCPHSQASPACLCSHPRRSRRFLRCPPLRLRPAQALPDARAAAAQFALFLLPVALPAAVPVVVSVVVPVAPCAARLFSVPAVASRPVAAAVAVQPTVAALGAVFPVPAAARAAALLLADAAARARVQFRLDRAAQAEKGRVELGRVELGRVAREQERASARAAPQIKARCPPRSITALPPPLRVYLSSASHRTTPSTG